MNIEKLNEQLEKALKSDNDKIYLNEMSTAWFDKQANKCVWVENPTGHNNKYFKYLDAFTYSKGKHQARISMLRPEYVHHSNMDGKKEWKLNNKEKKQLIELMNKPNKKYNCTNWQATLITYNEDNFGITFDETINGTFDKKEYPNAFDINTSMPDYMLL